MLSPAASRCRARIDGPRPAIARLGMSSRGCGYAPILPVGPPWDEAAEVPWTGRAPRSRCPCRAPSTPATPPTTTARPKACPGHRVLPHAGAGGRRARRGAWCRNRADRHPLGARGRAGARYRLLQRDADVRPPQCRRSGCDVTAARARRYAALRAASARRAGDGPVPHLPAQPDHRGPVGYTRLGARGPAAGWAPRTQHLQPGHHQDRGRDPCWERVEDRPPRVRPAPRVRGRRRKVSRTTLLFRERAGGQARVSLTLRYVYRYEMEHLLARAGFEVEALYGDHFGAPFEEASPEMVWVARRAG